MHDTKEILERALSLIAMDEEIRLLGDEDIICDWLTHGVPDGATEYESINILLSIAEDEELYQSISEIYDSLYSEATDPDGDWDW